MKTHIAPAPRGFTLLEVLVALVVLATGLLALAKFQGTLMQDNALSKQRTEATMYAQQQIETLRSYSLMSSSDPHVATYSSMATGNDSVTGTSATFTRSWTVNKYTSTDASTPQYTTITVSMTWKDNSGTNQTYTLSTNIAANAPINSGQLIGTTTTTVPTTTTSSTSSTTSTSTSTSTSSSTSTSTTSSTTSSTTTSSTTTTSAVPSTTTTTTSTTTTTTQCQTTISGTTQKNWDTVSSSPSGTCSAGQKTYTCIVTAGRGTTITLTENNGARQQTSANCGSVTVNM